MKAMAYMVDGGVQKAIMSKILNKEELKNLRKISDFIKKEQHNTKTEK